MLNDFLYAVWFFMPAGAANIAPILVARLPVVKTWNAPLDFSKTYRGKRILGSSKTWRGLVAGTILAMIIFGLQKTISSHLGSFTVYLESVHYLDLSLWLGVLMGAGSLIGDATESFFKRQAAVLPGKSWFPFDQIDYIVGASLATMLVIRLQFKMYIWILLVWFLLHLLFSYLGYLLKFKSTPI